MKLSNEKAQAKNKNKARAAAKAKMIAKRTKSKREFIDYSSVTPATGVSEDSIPVAESLANHMPTADLPSFNGAFRADPDKIIPGSEAATGVDHLEVDSRHMGTVTITY